MIQVKRVDIPLYEGIMVKPTNLQPVAAAVNEIGEDKIQYITCASSHPKQMATYTIFYHED